MLQGMYLSGYIPFSWRTQQYYYNTLIGKKKRVTCVRVFLTKHSELVSVLGFVLKNTVIIWLSPIVRCFKWPRWLCFVCKLQCDWERCVEKPRR